MLLGAAGTQYCLGTLGAVAMAPFVISRARGAGPGY